MINEDAPTNSVGTGAETALPPSHEPPGITRLTKRKVKKRKFEKSVGEMLTTEQVDKNYLPFRVSFEDGQTDQSRNQDQTEIMHGATGYPSNFSVGKIFDG